MTFMELVQRRESCRQYADRPVEKGKIMACMEAARLAPSACNSQPWHFVVAAGDSLPKQVAACTHDNGMNAFTDHVPVFIAIVEEKAKLISRIASSLPEQAYAPMDIGIAAAHICLQAAELGLSTCIVGWFNDEKLKECLSLPPEKHIRLLIAMGYAATDERHTKIRKPLDEIVQYQE